LGKIAAVDQIPVANKDFHLKEYESLKQEVSEQVEHTRKLEIYAVGGIAAFYAWFIGAQPLPHELLIIPSLLAGLGAWRSGAALKRINEIAAYLVKLEGVFAISDEKLGWETHRKNNLTSPFLLSGTAFWGTLILVTAVPWLLP
jgi:hypothetical protein